MAYVLNFKGYPSFCALVVWPEGTAEAPNGVGSPLKKVLKGLSTLAKGPGPREGGLA